MAAKERNDLFRDHKVDSARNDDEPGHPGPPIRELGNFRELDSIVWRTDRME